jgi:hypothetical protein
MLPLPNKVTLKQVWVEIQLLNDGWTSDSEFNSRYALEDEVEARGIGRRLGAGSGGGWMDFNFAVDDIDTSLNAFIKLLSEAGQLNQSEIEILRYRTDAELEADDKECWDGDEFQAGDALTFRYADGDYGAGLVVRRTDTTEMHPWCDQSLLAVLNYKSPESPTRSVFEQRQWFITTREWNRGERYLAWMNRCGVELFQKVDQIALRDDDVRRCQFHLDWELLAEMVEIERRRLTR